MKESRFKVTAFDTMESGAFTGDQQRVEMTQLPQFDADVFNVVSMDHAKRVILTAEAGLTMEERWEKETEYLVDEIIKQMPPDSGWDTLADYGCGIGRISKALLNRFNYRIVGVDISPSMRSLAAAYVQHDNFVAVSPAMFGFLHVKVKAAISIWTLQHCEKPERDLELLYRSLHPDGRLFVVNEKARFLPTKHKWVNDGIDVFALLKEKFKLVEVQPLAPEVVTEAASNRTYMATFTPQ
jgi:ubiquinone/menaquinone biosynthesis C-methylase UbiE